MRIIIWDRYHFAKNLIISLEESNRDWPKTKSEIRDGFVTNAGRFVDRHEAGEIALRAEQLAHLAESRKSDASDSLDAHNIQELRPKWVK